MGAMKFNLTFEGQVVQKMIAESWINSKYNLPLLEKIILDSDDVIISNDLPDTIDWSKYNLPEWVRQVIKDLEYYSSIHYQLTKIYESIGYVRFSDRSKLRTLANEAIRILETFEFKDSLDNGSLSNSIVVAVKDLKHTNNNKEVDDVLRLRDKDANYRKQNTLDDAIRHLQIDLQSPIAWLARVELNSKLINN